MNNQIRLLCVLFAWMLQTNIHAQVPILNSNASASAVMFLDFDGHTLEGSSWNSTGPIYCGASGLNNSQLTEVFNRVAEDYRPFNINVTTDSTRFLSAPANRRMRIILTVSSSWYGTAGGVSFVGSFIWGDDTPAFVFTALHGYNVKNIAEATAHEAGHTLGLYHQSRYDVNCVKITDYDAGVGTGEIGWAPIMGVGYYKNFTLWNLGPNSWGCDNIQSDLDIITHPDNGIGYRNDDHGSSFATATVPTFSSHQFNAIGIIEKNTDQDYFRFIMPGRGRFQLDAIPYNVGTGNNGSDLDMQVTLFSNAQSTLSVYNPGALLNSVADTTLDAGTYYLKVEGKGNLYAPAYASLGSYSLQARIEDNNTPLPIRKIILAGLAAGDVHQLSWAIDADEPVIDQALEVAIDGRNFQSLVTPTIDERRYDYRPSVVQSVTQYRLRVELAHGMRFYSNTIAIREEQNGPRPRVISNLLESNTVYVSSPGPYSYSILDLNGRTIAKGRLTSGINTIVMNDLKKGMYLVRFNGNDKQWTDKILRQ